MHPNGDDVMRDYHFTNPKGSVSSGTIWMIDKCLPRIVYNYLDCVDSATEMSSTLIPRMRTIVHHFRVAFILERQQQRERKKRKHNSMDGISIVRLVKLWKNNACCVYSRCTQML